MKQQLYNNKVIGTPAVDWYQHLVQRGGAWAGCNPAHPSTASVPTYCIICIVITVAIIRFLVLTMHASYDLSHTHMAVADKNFREHCLIDRIFPRDCSLARLHSAAHAVVQCQAGWLVSVTFVYCAETAKDTAIVATEYE